MAFKDSSEVVTGSLTLPVDGKPVIIKSPPASVGLRLAEQQAVLIRESVKFQQAKARGEDYEMKSAKLNDAEELDLYQDLLGPDTVEELKSRGTSWETIQFVGSTVYIWVTTGRDAAESYWNAGGKDPKEPKKPADRKPKKAAAKKALPVSAGSSTTPAADTVAEGEIL